MSSACTIRCVHQNLQDAGSAPSSPKSSRSSGLPSPPDSPNSVSSFPSVSSSFFFSSAAASPPHLQSHSDYARDSTHDLIIPSLTLPSALKQPTAYGKTLGRLRLVYVTRSTKGTSSAENFIGQLLDTPDVVDVGAWEQTEHGRLIKASTDWIELYDAHGLERFEPSYNVEILEIPGYDHDDNNIHDMLQKIKLLIHSPFHSLHNILLPQTHSPLASQLLSSSYSPLYTALILALPPSPSHVEEEIIAALSSQVPLILLHRPSSRHQYSTIHKLSSFKPSTLMALRNGLFRSPDTISSLRSEAAERFLEWREVEETVSAIQKQRSKRRALLSEDPPWTKAEWESDLESLLSQQVAMRLREEMLGELVPIPDKEDDLKVPNVSLDPLHLRSLLMFSLSLLGPLQRHIGKAVFNALNAIWSSDVQLAVIGGFCLGVGTGICIMR